MPVKKEPNGRRFVEVQVEVPGTPEEVWLAIASGPGISSWFVPTRVEERVGGKVEASFGPNMDSLAKITEWDPPRRYVAESTEDMGPEGPTLATEWVVEARDGGRCVVRVVHSWFASTDDWDGQFEQHEHGWNEFFKILRAYLTDFRGQNGTILQLVAAFPAAKDVAWSKVLHGLGFERLEPGASLATRAGAPKLEAVVDRTGEREHPEMLFLKLAKPAPGYMHMFAMPMGGQTIVPMRMFLFGPRAEEIARREEVQWQAWIDGVAKA
jgi:uncharacterized protein YndB with AHSA1/START domain